MTVTDFEIAQAAASALGQGLKALTVVIRKLEERVRVLEEIHHNIATFGVADPAHLTHGMSQTKMYVYDGPPAEVRWDEKGERHDVV